MNNSKLHCLFFLFLFLNTHLFAQNVSQQEAAQLVKTIIKNNAKNNLQYARGIKITERFTKKEKGLDTYHIFNIAPTGFVIIAADDRYHPVLAFSDESQINLQNKAHFIGLWGTLSVHEQRIQYLKTQSLKASAAIQKEWIALRTGKITTARNNGIVVAPLTSTKWNQGQYYNAACPANEDTEETGPDGRTYCGCGPVAMAQLIKFHNYPTNGNGSNSYIDPIYGEQSADFCNTQYDWTNMPDVLEDYNADVAEFIYQVGVSTYTHYSTEYTSTYISYMRDAFVNYFGYDQSANWFFDANDDFHWVAKNDLDRGRPLLLSGESIHGGAHTWVADGYGYFNAAGEAGDTEYFHFNWGWGGDNNGWFLDNAESWYPRQDDTTNVEITYYFDRYVIQNLFPAKEGCQVPESIYANGENDHYAYVNVYYPSGAQDISFRYRKVGSNTWQTTNPTSNYYQLLQELEAGTEYEYQARRKCCPDDWSPYSDSQTFTTTGAAPNEPCSPINGAELSISSTTDTYTYVYTPQPYGKVTNQFRFRAIDATDWIETTITNSYYRFLANLTAGTEYEFQVRHECADKVWTNYSSSHYFNTIGEKVDEGTNNETCTPLSSEDLYTSSIIAHNAYIYTPQPLGAINNQFRYKPIASADWLLTDISNLYYRYLSDLLPATEYEFQVRHECIMDNWSNYSNSHFFTTTTTNLLERQKLPQPLSLTDIKTKKSEFSTNATKFYPNPVKQYLNIGVKQFGESGQLKILNHIGKTMLESKLPKATSSIQVDVNALNTGVYFLQLRWDDRIEVHKFIKN